MAKISDIAEQITNCEDPSMPELVKVDIQVRTSGNILPPSWLKSSKQSQDSEPSKK